MRKRVLLMMLCSLILALGVFMSPVTIVRALEDTTEPVITGVSDQIEEEYQIGEPLYIDKTAIQLSDDVTSEATLRSTLSVKVYNSSSQALPNLSDEADVCEYEFSVAGTYTLVVKATDEAGNTATLSIPVTVISNSTVNKRYERGFALGVSDFADTKLYAALLDEVKRFASSRGDKFTGDTLYSEMLLSPDFSEINISNKNITSLEGINNLRLDYLQKISITNNKITTIDAKYFEDAKNLKEINFASNQITSVKLPDDLANLRYVNLASNKLTSLDISNCTSRVESFEVNLAGNDIVSLNSVKLPTRVDKITLNMLSNNLSEVNDTYFTDEKFVISVGVQGIKDISNKTTTDTLRGFRYYRTNIEGLGIDVYNSFGKVPRKVKTISDLDIEDGNYIDVTLPIGEYFYEYTLDDAPVYSKYDVEKNYYLSQQFIVNPCKASYKFEHKGQTYDKIGKVTGTVKVYLSSADIDAGIDGKIMYSINLGDWREGNEIDCSSGGTFSIRVKVVCGDYESEETSVFVQTSLNPVIPDVVMFFIVLFLAIVLFVVIVPVVSKKFFR